MCHEGTSLAGGPVPLGNFTGVMFVEVGVGTVELVPGVTVVEAMLPALSFSISFRFRI